MQENICKPANLRNTYIDVFDTRLDTSKAVCYVNPQHRVDHLTEEDALKENKKDPLQTLVGPGLVVSNIDDLLKLDEALYTDILLNESSKDEMFTPVKLNDGKLAQLDRAPIYNALGWGIDIDNSTGKIVSHSGGSPGISTIFMRNITKKQTVIVLENTDNIAPVFFGINAMNILNNKPPARFKMD
jgi:CubicO group peptidase (beta-lactamase class C family)